MEVIKRRYRRLGNARKRTQAASANTGQGEQASSELTFQALFQAAPDAIVIADANATLQLVNGQAERLFGYEAAELVGQPIEVLLPERLRSVHREHRAAYAVSPRSRPMGTGLELLARRKDGSEFLAEVSLSPLRTPQGWLTTSVIRDITARKQAERDRAQLAAIVDSSDDAIIGLGLDGTIVSWNRGAQQVYGYEPAETLGRSITLLVPDDRASEVPQLLERIHAGERIAGFETVRVRKDGLRIPISLTVSPITDAHGNMVGLSAIGRDITEHKRVEAALREREQRYRAIFNQTYQFIGLLRPDGTVLEANQTALDFAGLRLADVVNQPFWAAPWWPQTVEFQERLKRAIAHAAAGQFVRFEAEHHGTGGQSIVVDFSLKPVYDESGAVVLLIPEGRDITERKRAEERFAKIFHASPAGINITRLGDGVVLDVNRSFLSLTGYSRDEVVGHSSLDFRVWDDSVTRARMVEVLARRQPVSGLELKIRTKTGAARDLLMAAEFMELAGQPCVLGIFQDITERKRVELLLEQQVRQRTAHLNTLLTLSRELFSAQGLDEVMERAVKHALQLVPEADAGALYVHDAGTQALSLRVSIGFDQAPPMQVGADGGLLSRALGTRSVQIVTSAAECHAEAAELQYLDAESRQLFINQFATASGMLVLPLLTDDEPLGVLALIRRAGDGPFATDARATLEGLANLVTAAMSEAQGRVAASRLSSDLAQLQEEQRLITQRLSAAEAGMLQAARLAAVGQLAASIAHEINNPLYAARNSLYLLSKSIGDEGSYLGLAREQLARIARIIERMRDFYRPDRGELAEHNLNQLLEETLGLVGLNKDGRIQMIFAPAFDLPPVRCNGDQLRQVFLNLVLNALDAMPEGGTLTVRTKAEARMVAVEIQDTGVGIPDELRPHLFEPFWTSKPHGTGLGLSISGHIVTQHNGRIEIESRPGEGSLFRVVLPYQAQQ